MTHRRIAALPLIIAALCTSACTIDLNGGGVVVREERSFAVSGEPDLQVETFDGSVQVSAWDRPDVRVRIEKRGRDRDEAAALQVKVTHDGNRLRVEALAPAEERSTVTFGTSRNVSFTVSVPRSARVLVRSGDGSINVEGVAGRVELHSDDGSIRASRVAGEVVVESADGSVHVDGRLALLRASTQDGSVSVEADAGSAPSGDWEVSTGDGSVNMNLPGSFSANIQADTGDGSISVSGIPEGPRDEDRRSVRGTLGRGGHLLKVRSGDGSIRIAAR
jgi:DUF4097 and DUF4098 domain-containing protein YvlB